VEPSSPTQDNNMLHAQDFGNPGLHRITSRHSAASMNTIAKVHVGSDYDVRKFTAKGFGSIAVVAIFMASVQAQVLAFTITDNTRLTGKVVNGLWIAGLTLDVYGTMLASLTERWFTILTPEDTQYLSNSWLNKNLTPHDVAELTLPQHVPTEKDRESIAEKVAGDNERLQNIICWIVATGLFSAMPTIAAGFFCFIAGLFIYSWAFQPRVVSVIATIPLGIMLFLIGGVFLLRDETKMKRKIIDLLRDKRGTW